MEPIKEWLAVIAASVGVVVWLVRLEASVRYALNEVANLEKQIDQDRKATIENRKEQSEMLREMRADIKRILERGPSNNLL